MSTIKSTGKLETSHHNGSNGGKYKRKKVPKYSIHLAGSPNSCLIKIDKQNFRVLVDSGASVSLMHSRIYNLLKNKPKLKYRKVYLQGVDGSPLRVLGCCDLKFKIGGKLMTHTFFVAKHINRNFILGQGWLLQNGVRLYFDLKCLRINGSYVPLQEDIHVASVVRLAMDSVLKPQTVNICPARLKNNPSFKPSEQIEIEAVDSGFISTEPGLMVGNSLVNWNNNRRFPLMITNNTNKTIRLKRGCVIGYAPPISKQNVATINAVDQGLNCESNSIDKSEIDAPEEEKETIFNLIKNNEDVFASSDKALGKTTTVTMSKPTYESQPIRLRPYRINLNDREADDKALDSMLENNIIRPSQSPWAFPLVIARKSDGSLRLCVDYRKLNQITKINSYPLPLIDDILSLLGKAKYISTVDARSGYYQVGLEECDKEKTSFVCFKGIFEFNVMPFGLCNAPSVFQHLMSIVLNGCQKFATAYLDDILIFSETKEEHFKHIQIVFDRLREHNLKLKLKKCSFLKTETKYLGFVIGNRGLKPDPDKVRAIRRMPPPKTVKQIRQFIGVISYFRRFCPNFSQIAEPLIALTKKHAKFYWSTEQQKAFEFLKESDRCTSFKLPRLK